jgi:hypothetical protein
MDIFLSLSQPAGIKTASFSTTRAGVYIIKKIFKLTE